MNLRQLSIGLRLAAGFTLILLAAAAMLGASLWSGASSRARLVQAVELANQRQDRAIAMSNALLAGSVAARNMGLETKLEGVEKAKAEALKEQAAYADAKKALLAGDLGSDERAMLERLDTIDKQRIADFTEAVDLASQFNTEQAAAVIVQKVDPALRKSRVELGAFIESQRARAAQAMEQEQASGSRTQWTIAALGVCVIVLSAGLAWLLTRSITGPLRLAEQATSRVSAGDLTYRVDASGHDEVATLMRSLNAMSDNLTRLVSEVRGGSDSIATGSSEIATGNCDLSSRTEQQASSLQQTAASMKQLTATVRTNADTAREATDLAGSASAVARQGGEAVGQVVHTMQAITASSRKIADIISVIDGITFQTNILALNAAAEAARAGDQGRGFAVVAAEVRTLAQRSADAAKEIKTLIEDSVSKVESGSRQVGAAGRTMDEIVLQVQRVSDLITTISTATGEQSKGIGLVGDAVQQLDQVTQQNAALVEQSAAAAESLKQQASRLLAMPSACSG